MSYLALVGSAFAITTGLASAKAISNITNADPGVVTATAHGYNNTDEVLLVTDWEDFNYSIFRVTNKTTDTFELAGYDTSNTTFYPAGSDTGTSATLCDTVLPEATRRRLFCSASTLPT